MWKLLATLLVWIGRKMAVFLLVLCALVAGAWLKEEWGKLSGRIEELAAARAALASLEHDIALRGERFQQVGEELRAHLGRATAAWTDEAAAKALVEKLQKEAGFLRYKLWVDPVYKSALAAAEANWRRLHDQAAKEEEAKRVYQRNFEGSPEQAAMRDLEEKRKHRATLAAEIDEKERALASDPRQRLMAAARAQLPAAALILVGLLLSPALIKAALYYLVAPWAGRLPPIRIAGEEGTPALPEVVPAAVSQPVALASGEELLVHPDYLQSSALPAKKETRWLLDAKLPFTSLASGMAMLTRLRPGPEGETRVVVSAQNDPLGEVAIIVLPAGAAMVIQPRSLAGVVRRAGEPVRITRHWRLGSLHGWLTLQLRFLVFHGPCRLILKGCRGIRAEQPDPANPRLLNQSATVGFSANLAYRNVRCETFVSYLRGKESLFNDLFAGENGLFVYEEVAQGGRGGARGGRGLEGVLDTLLKVFGI